MLADLELNQSGIYRNNAGSAGGVPEGGARDRLGTEGVASRSYVYQHRGYRQSGRVDLPQSPQVGVIYSV